MKVLHCTSRVECKDNIIASYQEAVGSSGSDYYSSIQFRGLQLEIAVDQHTWGFHQLSDNLQGSIEVHSRSISHIVHILYLEMLKCRKQI